MQSHFAKRVTIGLGNALWRFAGNKKDAIGGIAAIEFAIMTPLLIVLMICVVDAGMGFYRKMQVQNAAQAGAQYAVIKDFTPAAISNAVLAATSFSAINASPQPTQYCGCPEATGVTTATCNSTCGDGSRAGTYVTVSAQGTYNTILDYPLIPSSFAFAAQSTVRLR